MRVFFLFNLLLNTLLQLIASNSDEETLNMSLIIILLVLLLLYIHLWLKNRRNFWKIRGFISEDLIFPFGSLEKIGREKSLCDGLDEFYKKYKGKGPAVGLFSFVQPFLLPLDTELIRNILTTNFDCFQNRGLFYNKKDDPISAHLLALEGEYFNSFKINGEERKQVYLGKYFCATGREWRERRVKLTPTFTTGKMKLMFEIIDKIGGTMVKVVEKAVRVSNDIEIQEFLTCFTTDSIAKVAFGLESNSLEDNNSEFRKYGKETTDLSSLDFLKFFFTTSFPELSRKLCLTANKGSVIKFFHNIFTENMKERERSNIARNDFMQLLLDLKRSTSLTISELAAESFIFFLGGKQPFPH